MRKLAAVGWVAVGLALGAGGMAVGQDAAAPVTVPVQGWEFCIKAWYELGGKAQYAPDNTCPGESPGDVGTAGALGWRMLAPPVGSVVTPGQPKLRWVVYMERPIPRQ